MPKRRLGREELKRFSDWDDGRLPESHDPNREPNTLGSRSRSNPLEREAMACLPKVILFDLGGVLMDFAGLRRLQAVLPGPVSYDEVQGRWLGSSSVREFELGRLSPIAFAERFVAEWSLDQSPMGFLAEFETWAPGFYPGILPLLEELRAQYRLACLSNSNAVHMGALRDSMDGQFERQFISCDMGLAKPEPAVFEVVIKELDVAGSDVLFFDDSAANVSAATSAGMVGERVRGPDELRERLRHHGLIGSADGARRAR
jgi:putative hydrolase of the HAD superfamily